MAFVLIFFARFAYFSVLRVSSNDEDAPLLTVGGTKIAEHVRRKGYKGPPSGKMGSGPRRREKGAGLSKSVDWMLDSRASGGRI